jgi:NADH-quinone oxidoreductase subunit H
MFNAIFHFFCEYPWILIALIAHGVILGAVAYLILLERKTASWVQDRIGPNRVGFDFGLPALSFLKGKFGGLGQPLADGIKFIVKEDYRPAGVDRILFTVAPGLMVLCIIVSIAVLPWGGIHRVTHEFDVTGASDPVAAAYHVVPGVAIEGTVQQPQIIQQNGKTLARVTYDYPFQASDLNIGVLFILAVLSLAVYGVVLGGWASNNKYSFLGGLRATAQMVSYEIPLGLSVLCIVIQYGTLNLGTIVEQQVGYWAHIIPAWNVFAQPVTFFMFLTCIHAEANRAPFDMAEAEQELVGGYHTEYSAMRFALFFLGEYAGMVTTSVVCVCLFFGGWHLPYIDMLWKGLSGHVDPAHPAITTSFIVCIARSLIIFSKTILIIFVFMWVRWSLPRFRFDQLMMLAWRALIPMALGLIVMTTFVVWLFGASDRAYGRIGGRMGLVLLFGNIIVLAGSMLLSKLLPPPPKTNRRVRVVGSRFNKEKLPAASF